MERPGPWTLQAEGARVYLARPMQHVMLDAIWQLRLIARLRTRLLRPGVHAGRRLGRCPSIDIDDAVLHLDTIPGESDDALDVVAGAMAPQLANHHIAAPRLSAPTQRSTSRIHRRSVGTKYAIADEEPTTSSIRKNVERLIKEGAHGGGQQNGRTALKHSRARRRISCAQGPMFLRNGQADACAALIASAS